MAIDIVGLYKSHASDPEQCSLPNCKVTGCTRDGSVELSKKLFLFKIKYLYPTDSILTVAGEIGVNTKAMELATILLIEITAQISLKDDLHRNARKEGTILRRYSAPIYSNLTQDDAYSATGWYDRHANLSVLPNANVYLSFRGQWAATQLAGWNGGYPVLISCQLGIDPSV